MLPFDRIKLYSQAVDGIRYSPVDKEKPFLIVYFSENSSFPEDYEKLNIRLVDARSVVVPTTKLPRTRLDIPYRKLLRSFGLFSFLPGSQPTGRNIIYDTSMYISLVDATLKPENYRQRAGLLIKTSLRQAFSEFQNYRKILLYSIDLDKPFPQIINRKIFPILQEIKKGDIPFDSFAFCIFGPKGTRYRLLMKDDEYKFEKLYTYLKAPKFVDAEEENEDEANQATDEVMKSVAPQVMPQNIEKVKTSVRGYLKRDTDARYQILSKTATTQDHSRIAAASIIHRVSGNYDRAKQVSNILAAKKKIDIAKSLKIVDKNLSDQVLEKEDSVNSAENIVTKNSNISGAVDNKNPSRLFQKRQIDFATNLVTDLTNSFKVLERKSKPIIVEGIEIIEKPPRPGEIEPSDLNVVKVHLKDFFGRKHTINLEVPRIDPSSGTFRVNGRRKCLINQIVPCPITFPKKYDGRFESSYSSFHIYSKRSSRMNYLEAYIASYRIPLIIFLAYGFGFDSTLANYGITYSIVDKKPPVELFYKLDKNKYIVFDGVKTEVQLELINSFLKANLAKYNIEKEFPSKDYFTDLLHEMTGRVNSSYLVNNIIANIVDPVAKQILVNMQLPSDLPSIIKYMSIKVLEGYVQDRNDLSNMRIRGSEVLVQLTQKQILAAYTEYEEQVLSGNTKADFKINSGKVLSDFINSEIVTDMEYANPIEEMATMTRVSPVGKGIGGIPDKEAIQIEARNVHPSYYGNIDPLDTPESGNIGVIQQLAIDALITSARGLFSQREINDAEGAGILSTSSAMIPFIENNEGVRIIMAVNQSRQSQPLKDPEPPIVQSGYESLLTRVLSNNFIKRSPCAGKILRVTKDNIEIICRDGSKKVIDITPTHLNSGSGKNTLSVFNPTIKDGQSVLQNQIIAEGSSISGGSIALGRTLCVAFMPYKGYNFEDGIIINEKLLENNKLTSLHGIIEEVEVTEKDRVLNIVPIGIRTEKGQEIFRKTIGEIEELIGYNEEDEDSVINEGKFIKKSPGGIVVDIEVFCNASIDKYPLLKDLILRTNKRYGISKDDKITSRGIKIEGAKIRFKIEQELKIGLGDKLCNRYGNKGIISLVEKDELMPRTPWGDTIDIILNPIGVISRMNVGQIYEMYTGLISKALALRIIVSTSKTQILSIIKDVLNSLDGTKNQTFSNQLVKSLSNLNDIAFKLFLKQINDTKFFPIIVPPFKGPKINQLKIAMRLLNLKTGYELYLPEFGRKVESPVPVGYMYIQKLEHLGEMKTHSRSTGPTISKTLQPTAGKRREGGQRVGEADTWALISYNCLTVLDEFFGPLSDDLATKEEIISDIIRTGNANYRPARTSPIRELISSYFVALMLERT